MRGPRELMVALLLLAACGRLEFEATTDTGVGDDDAIIPACAGHDEDGDGVGDACDRCPTVADPGQEDRGELDAGELPDGVGDACDPRPAIGGDRIALFESYAQPPQVTLNTFGPVMWDGNDALVLGGAGATGQAFFSSVARFTRAELRYRIVSVTTDQTAYGGLWTRIGAVGLTDSVFPQVSDQLGDSTPARILIKEATGTMDLYSSFVDTTRELTTGDAFQTVHDTELVTGGAQRYTVRAPVTSGPLVTELAVTRPFTGEYAVEAVELGMELQSLVLYDAP